MIIIGYPGVGKTVASQQFTEVIDLESSCVPKIEKKKFNLEEPDWFEKKEEAEKNQFVCYCNIAESLSKQGYIVCVSSHYYVQQLLRKSTEQIYVCFPSKEVHKEWITLLRKRYMQDKSEKNLKALNRVAESFEYDVDDMACSGFDIIELNGGKFLSDVLTESFENSSEKQEVEDETENSEQE